MNDRPYLIVTAIVFLLVALAHLLRLTMGFTAQVGTMTFPVWGSLLVLIVTAIIGIWGLSLFRHKH